MVPDLAPWLTARDRTRIGPPSDEAGIARLLVEDLQEARRQAPDPTYRFAVEHPDYLPADLPITPPEAIVTLIRAETLVVQCISERGEPVAGVAFAASRFVEFEALRTAVVHILRTGLVPTPGPCAGTRTVCAGITDDRGIAEIRGCAPGEYAWIAGHEAWVPVGGPDSSAGLHVPGIPLRLVMAPLVAACVESDGTSPVLSINVDWDMSQFDRGPLSRRGGIAATLQLARADRPDGLRVQVPSAEYRREGRAPEIRYSVLFPSGWTHVDIRMQPIADGIERVLIAPPDGPDLTGNLVLALAGVPEPAAIQASMPYVHVIGDGSGGGTFHRIVRCAEPVRLPAGDYRLMTANPWIDTDQPLHVDRGTRQRVVLPLRRELRPCRLALVGPPGALLPAVDLWIGTRGNDPRERGLRLRSWLPELEFEDPEKSAEQWLPIGDVHVAVKGRGVVPSEKTFRISRGFEWQTLPIPVELSSDR